MRVECFLGAKVSPLVSWIVTDNIPLIPVLAGLLLFHTWLTKPLGKVQNSRSLRSSTKTNWDLVRYSENTDSQGRVLKSSRVFVGNFLLVWENTKLSNIDCLSILFLPSPSSSPSSLFSTKPRSPPISQPLLPPYSFPLTFRPPSPKNIHN